jgi:hypothetical protein
MSKIFHPLLALIASATDKELAKYVEYLKHENKIMRARVPGQIHTKPAEQERLTVATFRVLPKRPVGQAIGYVLQCWGEFTRYCENGALSNDNNLSERMVLPIAIGRKNWMFLGSDNGGKAAAILYSIMAGAKSNQVEPFAYVRDVLVRFFGKRPDDLSDLLPDEWLKTHPNARRRWSR